VTGGSGAVGSRLVEHLLARGPEVVRILGRDETKQLYQQIAYRGRPDVRLLNRDVRDRDRLTRAFEGIDTVFIALR
jgi:FlaA1/EpsC-like NDP-sugar epimerase